eukprot:4371456-Pyramimonas_sp.AAC.1
MEGWGVATVPSAIRPGSEAGIPARRGAKHRTGMHNFRFRTEQALRARCPTMGITSAHAHAL